MAHVTQDKYSPYPRVCDICGQLRSINTMRKLDGQTFVCDKHPGERTAIMLDTLNAHARPPQTWPNRDAKPQNPEYPNTLEADEGALFDFIDRQIQAVARFEQIAAGQAAAPSLGGILPAMGWAAKYLYGLIVQGTRLTMLTRARALLLQVTTYLRTLQTAISTPSSLSTSPFYGGLLASGASTYVTEDTATGGLAFLYAYRLTGTITWKESAIAAASYLRNVQAIGRYATQYTSSDSAGTARLYTGAVASQVSTAIGVDAGDIFYSNHLFYPSDLVTLEFWNELETTLGDMTIGATGTASDAFVSAPSQLLSLSITDMRTCWEDGIRDANNETFTGLSITTPREYFNAFPAVKANFTTIGTGEWEFQDGPADTGTIISAQNFAKALGSLFAYEGQSTQVGTVSDWLRTFASNEEFETPDDTSVSVLARSTTGDYDPTETLSTLLLVRDPDDDYAACAENASSLYDWGAFGVLAPLWFARYATSFKSARLGALGITQRFNDGLPSDGLYYDRIELRGLSGLTFQTAFATNIEGGQNSGSTPYAIGTSGITSPSTEGLVLWLKGDAGLSPASGTLTAWLDQSGMGQDITVLGPAPEPKTGIDTINGIPCVTFPTTDGFYYAGHTGNLKKSDGTDFAYTDARTIYAVIKPVQGASSVVGGPVFATPDQPNFECLFDVEQWFTHTDAWFIFDNIWKLSGYQLLAPDTTRATWNGTVVVAKWMSTGYPNVSFAVNGGGEQPLTDQAGTPTTDQLGGTANPPGASFVIGNCWNNGGGIQEHNFHGAMAEVLVFDHAVTGEEDEQNIDYLGARFTSSGVPQLTIGVVNDAVRAAQYGISYRSAH